MRPVGAKIVAKSGEKVRLKSQRIERKREAEEPVFVIVEGRCAAISRKIVKIWAKKSQRFHEIFADPMRFRSITFSKSSFVLVKRIHEKLVLESSSCQSSQKIETSRVLVGHIRAEFTFVSLSIRFHEKFKLQA